LSADLIFAVLLRKTALILGRDSNRFRVRDSAHEDQFLAVHDPQGRKARGAIAPEASHDGERQRPSEA